LIVEAGLSLYFADRADGLAFRQRAVVGHVACLVSRALTELISQPGACAAVNQDNVETMAAVSASIAVRLNTASSADCGCAAEDLRELHAGS
jgi:hypothetical protein